MHRGSLRCRYRWCAVCCRRGAAWIGQSQQRVGQQGLAGGFGTDDANCQEVLIVIQDLGGGQACGVT